MDNNFHFTIHKNKKIDNRILKYLHIIKKAILKIFPQTLSILLVGNLKIQKNVPLLINAFDILANKFKDMNLIIVGSGREEKSIKFLASRKKNQNTFILLARYTMKNYLSYIKMLIYLYYLLSLNLQELLFWRHLQQKFQ